MIDVELTWREAAGIAGGLAVGTALLRRSGRRKLVSASVFTQESAILLALFALWQYAGSYAVMGPGGALGRGRWIWHAERLAGLPSETAVQQLFLPHPLLIQLSNLYYAILHFPVLIAVMIWLFTRHRDKYRRMRTTLVAFTGASLLIQFVPVAPPRFLPFTGMVDTAIRYHQSVYGSVAGFNADELSAMPSVHVGWAMLAAVAVIGTARTRWRWLALAYPAVTALVVVVTANHFWLDGIVALGLLGLVLGIQAAGRRATARARRPGNTGLYQVRLTWHDPGNHHPKRARGPHGNSSQGDEPRPAPERDRST